MNRAPYVTRPFTVQVLGYPDEVVGALREQGPRLPRVGRNRLVSVVLDNLAELLAEYQHFTWEDLFGDVVSAVCERFRNFQTWEVPRTVWRSVTKKKIDHEARQTSLTKEPRVDFYARCQSSGTEVRVRQISEAGRDWWDEKRSVPLAVSIRFSLVGMPDVSRFIVQIYQKALRPHEFYVVFMFVMRDGKKVSEFRTFESSVRHSLKGMTRVGESRREAS